MVILPIQMRKKITIGPGIYITSAFIGPGTITLCLLAGVASGLELLWAVVFSTLATVLLQDMCVRLGFYSKLGLEQTIAAFIKNPIIHFGLKYYVLLAILLGNCAYQSGNITGTSLGVQLLGLDINPQIVTSFIYVGCLYCILRGSYEFLKNLLSIMVFLMCISFIVFAIAYFPNISDLFKGIFIPKLSSSNLLTVIGLIGTTVVPYNLFLHTSLVAHSKESVETLRKDSLTSILVGGLISMAVVIVGSKCYGFEVKNIKEIADILYLKFGSFSKYLIGIGLFAAGFSSALTAPLAGALVTNGILSNGNIENKSLIKGVQVFILSIGYIVSMTKINSIQVIKFAQVINGILLPIFAIYLLYLLNSRNILKVHKNNLSQNFGAFFVILITILLAVKSLVNFL